MKTEDLTGSALDWAVAEARMQGAFEYYATDDWKPSTDWAQGGAIIEREQLSIECINSERWLCGWSEGATPLTAAMRCYVASKLGDDVEIPAKLMGETA